MVLRFQVFCKRFAPDDQIREGNVAQCTADMQRCRQSDQYCRVFVLTCNLLSMLKVKDSPLLCHKLEFTRKCKAISFLPPQVACAVEPLAKVLRWAPAYGFWCCCHLEIRNVHRRELKPRVLGRHFHRCTSYNSWQLRKSMHRLRLRIWIDSENSKLAWGFV